MGEATGIEWTERTGRRLGVLKTAARRLGVSFAEYTARLDAGEKWCSGCKKWHAIIAFAADKARGDGLAATCTDWRRSRYVRRPRPRGYLRGFLVPARPGDKKQARRRVNYLVERQRLPHPDRLACVDCGHRCGMDDHRHEYDHAQGYGADEQLYVEPVCAPCHHRRERVRRSAA